MITFHGIGPPPGPVPDEERDYWVDRATFESILDVVSERPDVGVTFDDGNVSDIEIAYPSLRERGLTAAFFVLAGRLGEPGSLAQDDVRLLAGGGMTVGSHGRRHCDWTAIDEATLEDEVVESRRQLEALLEAPVTGAACPFGAYDRRVLHALRRAGYREVYTSDGGPLGGGWIRARTTVSARGAADIDGLLDGAQALRPVARLKRSVKRWR